MATTKTAKLIVLDPTAAPREMVQAMAPALDGLGGQSLGFLWNSKPNGNLLFERLEKLLREKYEIADVIHRRKPTASLPAEDSVLDELAGSVQAVIVGLAD
ncbi:MAG: hypothetical protein J4N67_09125 [Chloroflexi bacterium]|nr:hypothetical protein [Chloroflexota bacterium]MCI0899106.1 hypothetical protein [Chloroflexota bacterium]